MRKILLTGHTSNIGKPLYEFLKQYYEVIGVSRQTNYDLTNNNDFERVIELSKDVDCVINLAYIKHVQVDLLYRVHKLWTETKNNGKIISVGSLGTVAPYTLHEQIGTELEVIANKLSLEKLHNELCYNNLFENQPKSILIRLASCVDKHKNIPYLKSTDINNIFKFILDNDFYLSNLDVRELL